MTRSRDSVDLGAEGGLVGGEVVELKRGALTRAQRPSAIAGLTSRPHLRSEGQIGGTRHDDRGRHVGAGSGRVAPRLETGPS